MKLFIFKKRVIDKLEEAQRLIDSEMKQEKSQTHKNYIKVDEAIQYIKDTLTSDLK